ncbi:Alpha/Beta hydrolase protein [Talaromyces proteolyticus]|uniref:Alpha/Beta hydrolase protein n=1 Tax=Talaromyces proteolyticus TaxID=1131652 RepID=A0AAD4KQG5_9EURO|nr:Alpha/Beta hydrolase protein [Talaromyces proteolyticus]KAH8698003.1 Alpha/Beta hydrolase protein [Talaromyces proteolyticus]
MLMASRGYLVCLPRQWRAKGLRREMAAQMSPNEEDLIARHKLKVTPTEIATIPLLVIEPPNLASEHEGKILLNFFGGGVIMGSARERAALLMAAEMRIRVYSVEYSKAPESRYPVARDEAFAAYRELNIYGMGSSAGAQILVLMLLVAHSEGIPMPARLFLCTPALDLSGAGDSMVSNEGRDIMPASFLSAMVQRNYQPNDIDLTDPLYSELLVSEGMLHGFNWSETLPEAFQLRKTVEEFLASSL